jgi:AcrR family transcriptional regulator
VARPLTALISREAIIEAALRLVDEHGMAGLSIRRIAAELGVDGSSLYHYFASKDDILDAVAGRVLAHVRPSYDEGRDWKAHLVDACLEVRRALARHPNVTPALVARRQWKFGLPFFEHAAGMMTDQGVPPTKQLLIWESLDALTIGGLLLPTSLRKATAVVADLDVAYPLVHAALHADELGEEERLAVAVMALLTGIEALATEPSGAEQPGRAQRARPSGR